MGPQPLDHAPGPAAPLAGQGAAVSGTPVNATALPSISDSSALPHHRPGEHYVLADLVRPAAGAVSARVR